MLKLIQAGDEEPSTAVTFDTLTGPPTTKMVSSNHSGYLEKEVRLQIETVEFAAAPDLKDQRHNKAIRYYADISEEKGAKS